MSLPHWDTDRFGNPVASILGTGDRLPELAPKSGDEAARLRLDALAGAKEAPSPAVMGGLYLYFDLLEPAHKIALGIDTTTGSFLHGIMHRRQPDDDNSAYWFRRVGDHPVLKALAAPARAHILAAGDSALARDLFSGPFWDPFAFIKASSEARQTGSPERVTLLAGLQLLEWRLLFDDCFDQRP